jgi:glutamate synthase domain-containing protein 2
MVWTIFIFLLIVFIVGLIALLLWLNFLAKKPQHSIIRAHPYLGWMRYLLEKIGPEFRQYWFDDDNSGKPFSRTDFLGIVFSAKYRSDLLSFGSKRDFDKPGYYIANGLFPLLNEELRVDNQEKVHSMKYKIDHEGLFTRPGLSALFFGVTESRWVGVQEVISWQQEVIHPALIIKPFFVVPLSPGKMFAHALY